MPQVDLSSVCAGNGGIAPDRKVACETTPGDAESDDPPPLPPAAIDYAPESFFLSRDAEQDWLDQNAFIERKNSGKAANLNPNPNSNSNSIYGSQRHLKSKTSLFSLPKPQNSDYKNRRTCKPAAIRLFPRRSSSSGRKTASALSEPSSPKVSCMGRVRSRKKQAEPNPSLTKTNSRKKKTGFWNVVRAVFWSKGSKTGSQGHEPDGELAVPTRKKGVDSKRNCGGGPSEPAAAPGLGVMNRFASGRRSDAWAEDIETEAKSEPLDESPIWRRREKGAPPGDVDVKDRDWQKVGPASV